jgi:hypothetical protein
MEERSGANSAMLSAIAQSKILTEYLSGVDVEAMDLHFIENHLRSLFQFACSARSEATNSYGVCAWPPAMLCATAERQD